eukprot:12154580-Karenia_brevis.AAC.1
MSGGPAMIRTRVSNKSRRDKRQNRWQAHEPKSEAAGKEFIPDADEEDWGSLGDEVQIEATYEGADD